jgi:hypothetical protein
MPGVTASEGQRTTQARPIAASRPSRPSSRSTIIGVGIVGTLLTALTVGGVIMANGPAPTQLASAAAPVAAVAPVSVMVPAPVAPVIVPAPVMAVPPVAAPVPAPVIALASVPSPAPAPRPGASDQCRLGQPTQLALNVYAENSGEDGNRVRFIVGSYVSPFVTITRTPQTLTFPVPPGSRGAAQMVVEQQTAKGSTWDGVDGLDIEFTTHSRDHLRSIVNLHWTPRC